MTADNTEFDKQGVTDMLVSEALIDINKRFNAYERVMRDHLPDAGWNKQEIEDFIQFGWRDYGNKDTTE